MVPVGAGEAQASHSATAAAPAACIAGAVVVCSVAGAAVDAWRARRQSSQKQDDGFPKLWVIGMLMSSYALLIPGLVSHLFASKTDLFGSETVSEYDETMISLVGRLAKDHMIAGAILVTLYAMVVPMLKLVLLALGHYLQRGGPDSVRWARRCILVVQAVSKWASPDMFAYILLMYLIRGLDNPPSVNSFMYLDLGFTCFCVFCVGSTVSCLGIRVPEAPAEARDAAAVRTPARWLGGRAAFAAFVALAAGFACLLALGLTKSNMSLHLDMELLYEVRPELVPLKAVVDSMNLPALLRKEVSVWECMGALCTWISEGDVNCFIAFILYAGFAVLLPVVDMALLFYTAVLDCLEGSASQRSSMVLAGARKIRKLAMLDVSIMGCCVVTLSLASMRKRGVIVHLCPGIIALIGAELCHYAAAALVARMHEALGAGSEAEGAKEASPIEAAEASKKGESVEDEEEEEESESGVSNTV